MRSVFCRLVLALTFLFLIAPRARADALADKVPGDAVFFASWEGTAAWQAQYGKSRLKEIMDASTFQQTIAKVLAQFQQNPNINGDGRMLIEASKTLEKMTDYPTAIYIGPLDSPIPQAVILCQAGDASAGLVQEIQQFLPLAGTSPMNVRESGGFVLVELGDVKSKMEAALGHTAEKDLIKRIADVAAYKAATAQVQKESGLTVYVDAAAIVDQIDKRVIAQFPAGGPQPAWIAGNYRKNLNLDGFTQMAFTMGFDGRDWSTRAFIGLTGDKTTGLPSLFAGKPLDPALLKNAPESTAWLVAGRFDLEAFYQQVTGLIGKSDPRAQADLDRAKADFQKQFGIDLETDILKTMGDQWLAFTAPAVSGTSLLGVTIVSPAKDPDRLAKSLDQLAMGLSKMLGAQDRGSNPVHMSVEQYNADGVKVTYANVLLNPAVSIHDGKFYASLVPQGIVSAIDLAKAGKSILDNPRFQEMQKRLGVTDATTLSYVDLAISGPDSYAMLSQLTGMLGVFSNEFRPNMLPPLSKLFPHLTTAGAASWTDATGWHSIAIEPFPGAMLMAGGQQNMGVASVPMSIAVLLPSLGRARELANRTAEAANISGMIKGGIVWANDNNDHMPEHMAQLIAAGAISPKSLVTKRSSTPPMELTADQQKNMEKDWKVLLPAADEHFDFVYLGKGTVDTLDSAFILMYVNPSKVDVTEGMNIGFGDAHVEWVRPPQYRELFEANNKLREALHLAPFKLDDRGLPILDK